MADDESIIDKAIALIPGVAPAKRKPKPSPKVQLARLQRELAKLTRDVEKLGKLMMDTQKKKPQGRSRPAKPSRAGRKTRTARA